MYRALLTLCCLFFSIISSAQSDIKHIEVNAFVINKSDSTQVDASLYFEKLPYYDDMGIAKSSEQGAKFYLANNTEYNFRISKNGFQTYSEKLVVNDEDGDGSLKYSFYLEPDAEPELITLENLIFARASDKITASSYHELDDLVLWLNENPNMVIQLEGHTDFAGNAGANMRLSQARVESVKDYLTRNGIHKKRVLTRAFGGTQPLSKERTDEAKAKNRRVEVRIIRK